ncbi:MAG: hypothetical protein WA477_26150 [Candidatus Sulfotelmatobacter sp.]
MTMVRKLWNRAKDLLPVPGFYFGQPLLLIQSDDWGRVGLRDRDGLEHLQSAGLKLGERPYDFYSLETADDVTALTATLKDHHDSAGHLPSLQMNFVVSNLDFARMEAEDWRAIRVLPLAEGLPRGWQRPGLTEAYRGGIADGVLYPAVHGTTHFCRTAVERNLATGGERAALLRTLWQSGTPYIHWRMPWIGYEYWDAEAAEADRFLSRASQSKLIGDSVGAFAKLFSTLPFSACAPGYRANEDTLGAWAQHGIRVAQNGPGALVPPHFDGNEVLQVCRTVEFEPATDADFTLEACLRQAESCFALGIPAVVSIHSINFHSSVKDFRSRTLRLLDEFLTSVESRHRDLLYVHDAQLWDIVQKGFCQAPGGDVRVSVTSRKFMRAQVATRATVGP